MPLFSFPGEPRWEEARDAVVFDVELGDYRGSVFVTRRALHDFLGLRLTAEQCVEQVHLNLAALERLAEAKLRARELAPDANVEITSRDLRRGL